MTEAGVYQVAREIGYPVVVRPSYVLGGRGMAIVRDENHMREVLGQQDLFAIGGDAPILIDGYLSNAVEVDVDAIADDKTVFIAGVMEHIEEAGIHSGDSACSLPHHTLSRELVTELERQTASMARGLAVRGLMNVQFAVQDGTIFVLEVNPRASRTVPFVAKTIGHQIAKIAARVMAGEALGGFGLKPQTLKHIAVKEAVFPFARFPGVDTILGPEMRSTGEVMGLDTNFERAFAKSQIAGGTKVPVEGTVFVLGEGKRQAGARCPRPQAQGDGFPRHRDRRHTGLSRRARRRGRPRQEGARRAPAHRRRDEERRGTARLQHDRGRAGAQGLLRDPPHRPDDENPLLHDHIRRRAAVMGIAAVKAGTLDVAPLQSYAAG